MSSPKKEEPKKRPAISFGPYPTERNSSVEIAVWRNETEIDGREVITFNATIKRSYRKENEWIENDNFRPHDLPVLIHGLNQAYAWIMEQKNPNASAD